MNKQQMSTVEHMEAVDEAKIVWTEQGTPEEADEGWSEPWLDGEEIDELQSRWNSIQKDFVDAPRTSVEHADVLVAEAMEKIVRVFSEKRATLKELWIDDEDVSTEDLRIVLQHYRSFFNRLLIVE